MAGPAAPVIGGHNADFNLEGEQWCVVNGELANVNFPSTLGD